VGNLINPIGGRVGLLNFWHFTWPIEYNKKCQDLYFQLAVHVCLIINSFLSKVFRQNPKHSSSSVLHGILLKNFLNLWGF